MAEPKLVIDGREYPIPVFERITMGEARVMKRYTGKALEEIEKIPDSDPDLIAAFCHIALMSDMPNASFSQIEERVDKIVLAQLDLTGGEDEAEAKQPNPPSSAQNGNDAAKQRSGLTSEESSDETPATDLSPIGTPA